MLDDLLPEDVMAVWGDPADPSKPLFPEEEALVVGAFPTRRQEFAKGRECARAALAGLGLENVMLLAGENREPVWPARVVGSITHKAGLCGAAVGRSDRYAGIGIDAELAEPLSEALARRVCREEEMTSQSGFRSLESAIVSRLRFSAKEAVYKCLFPLTRAFLGFHDVSIELEDGSFHARLHVPTPLEIDGKLFGTWRRAGAHLVTAVWVHRAR